MMNSELEYKKINTNNVEYLNSYLETTINEFLEDKRTRSIDTFRNYSNDINIICRDLFKHEYKYLTKEELESLTVDDLIVYRDYLYKEENEYGERKYSNATINRRLSSFKSLVKYLKARGKINFPVSDMMTLLKNLPNESVEIDVLSMKDAERCLEFFKLRKNGYPVYLASKLSIDTGLRSREILTLTWKQFYVQEDKVIVKSKGKIKGKGKKDWEKEISLELYNEVLELKEEGKDKVFNITYSFIAKVMKEAIKELKLDDKDYSFHSFRKLAATNMHELTNDIIGVKEFLNHSNLNTTQRYVKSKKYGMTGVYSLGDKIDKDLYKKVDKDLLLEVIEELNISHLLNIKLSDKLERSDNR